MLLMEVINGTSNNNSFKNTVVEKMLLLTLPLSYEIIISECKQQFGHMNIIRHTFDNFANIMGMLLVNVNGSDNGKGRSVYNVDKILSELWIKC